jgi:Ca-activated chloride channel family protein
MGTYVARAILGAALVAVPLAARAQQARFRTAVDLIHVGVTVVDENGRLITDLTRDDFELYEEGRRQEVAFFAAGLPSDAAADLRAAARQMHLGLLFDTSGSMTDDIKLARSAAVRFLNTFPRAHDITLVDFDTEVRIARYSQSDFPRLVERIRSRKPDGWTALYDALGTYLDGAFEQDGRKILVLYSDGGDTRSAVTFSEAIEMLRTSDVTVYAVGFLENQPASVRSVQRMRLMQLADVTGGRAFFPSSSRMLQDIFDRIAAEIRSEYSLGFTSTNPERDGRWRRLEVRLAGPRTKELKLRARAGYFAPLDMDTVPNAYRDTPSR